VVAAVERVKLGVVTSASVGVGLSSA